MYVRGYFTDDRSRWRVLQRAGARVLRVPAFGRAPATDFVLATVWVPVWMLVLLVPRTPQL